jgi:hypothetical protein
LSELEDAISTLSLSLSAFYESLETHLRPY